MAEQAILFVYNADSGFMNSVSDYLHKKISPSTYDCKLCAVTFNGVGMDKKWKVFIDNLEVPVEFMHRDELLKEHGDEGVQFPCAFAKKGDKMDLIITANEINGCKSLDDLMKLVTEKVKTL